VVDASGSSTGLLINRHPTQPATAIGALLSHHEQQVGNSVLIVTISCAQNCCTYCCCTNHYNCCTHYYQLSITAYAQRVYVYSAVILLSRQCCCKVCAKCRYAASFAALCTLLCYGILRQHYVSVSALCMPIMGPRARAGSTSRSLNCTATAPNK
jgi:hypothetical protein